MKPETGTTGTFGVWDPIDVSLLSDSEVPQSMLQSERWSYNDIHYGIPVPKGRYLVTLYFAEIWTYAGNPLLGGAACLECDRFFDMEVEGQRVADYSPADAAAGEQRDGVGALFTATGVTFLADVEDGVLDIRLIDLGADHPPENPSIKGFTVRATTRTLPWLGIAREAEGRLDLTWPAYLDATLQSSSSALGPFDPDGGEVAREDLYNVLRAAPANGTRFYRLELRP